MRMHGGGLRLLQRGANREDENLMSQVVRPVHLRVIALKRDPATEAELLDHQANAVHIQLAGPLLPLRKKRGVAAEKISVRKGRLPIVLAQAQEAAADGTVSVECAGRDWRKRRRVMIHQWSGFHKMVSGGGLSPPGRPCRPPVPGGKRGDSGNVRHASPVETTATGGDRRRKESFLMEEVPAARRGSAADKRPLLDTLESRTARSLSPFLLAHPDN